MFKFKKEIITLLISSIFFIVGCSDNNNDESNPISITDFSIMIHNSSENREEQILEYNIELLYNETINIAEDSIEMILAEWVRDKKNGEKINKLSFVPGGVLEIEGEIYFNFEDFAGEEFINNQSEEPILKGIFIESNQGEHIVLIRNE